MKKALTENLAVPYLVSGFPAFSDPEGSLPYLQEPTTDPYPARLIQSTPSHPSLIRSILGL